MKLPIKLIIPAILFSVNPVLTAQDQWAGKTLTTLFTYDLVPCAKEAEGKIYFQRAEPYKFWVASGNHELDVYLKGESKAKATIYINETDSCYVEGDPRKLRYLCHGLECWVVTQLKAKTEN